MIEKRWVNYDCSHWMSGPGPRGRLLVMAGWKDCTDEVVWHKPLKLHNGACQTLKSKEDVIELLRADGWEVHERTSAAG
jgi:hypothetical protein